MRRLGPELQFGNLRRVRAEAAHVSSDLPPVEPVWAIVASRMGSSRLRGKTMAELAGLPSLGHILERLRRVPALDGVLVATTEGPEDNPIRDLASGAGIPCYSGSATDVLGRTLGAARKAGARTIVQVTGDCPLIDPEIVGRVIGAYGTRRPDYAANVIGEHRTFPAGLSVEVFATELLAEVDGVTSDPRDREHVSIYIYEHPERYRLIEVEAEGDERRPDLWLTLDTAADLEGIRAIFDALYPVNPEFGYRDILRLLEQNPRIAELNRTPCPA